MARDGGAHCTKQRKLDKMGWVPTQDASTKTRSPPRLQSHSQNLAGSSCCRLKKGTGQGEWFRNKDVTETKEVEAFNMLPTARMGLNTPL